MYVSASVYKNAQQFTLGAKCSFGKDDYSKTACTRTYTHGKTLLRSEFCNESWKNEEKKWVQHKDRRVEL